MVVVGLCLCFLPLIIGITIFTAKCKLKITHQLVACLLGLIAVLPISFVQFFMPDIFNFIRSPILYLLLNSFILYGLIEELFKMALIIPLPHKNYSIKSFLLLAFTMGLTIGCFESAIYYLDHLQQSISRGAQLLYTQIFLRIFTSDIIHMTCTGLSAIFIYSCRIKQRKISPLFWAILLHGIYDFFAGFDNNLKYFSTAVVLLAIAECRIKYVNIKKIDD